MTMPYNAEMEKNSVLEIIEHRLQKVSNEFSRRLLLLALLELEETERFESTEKGLVDLTNSKTIRYFMHNLSVRQQLYFIRFLINHLEGTGVRIAVNAIVRRYGVSCRFKEIETVSIVDTAKLLLLNRKPGDAYRLLEMIGIQQNFGQVFGESEEELIAILMKEAPFLLEDETEFLYNIKYGLRKDTINDIGIWMDILQQKVRVSNASISALIIKYARDGMFSNETLMRILEHKGVSAEDCKKCIENKKYLIEVLKPASKESIYREPFYSLMKDEKKMINLFDDENFENRYAFSDDKRINRDADFRKNFMKEDYAYFDQCAKNFSSAKALIRVYFNTPLKYVVNFEYLIETLYKRFDYDNRDFRYLLRGYTLKGRVCKVNDTSISIRAYNIWTLLPCRMNKQKSLVIDGNKKRFPSKGEIIYFKFDYLALDSHKVNVYLPVLSLEKMRELESQMD